MSVSPEWVVEFAAVVMYHGGILGQSTVRPQDGWYDISISPVLASRLAKATGTLRTQWGFATVSENMLATVYAPAFKLLS